MSTGPTETKQLLSETSEDLMPQKVAPIELQIKTAKLKVHSSQGTNLAPRIETGIQKLEGVMQATYAPPIIKVMYRSREISLRTLID